MKIKIGTVGPEDSVEILMEEVKKHEEFEAVPICYKQTSDLMELITKDQSEITYWLFSGQAPYDMAVSNGLVDSRNAGYPPLYGASLLGRLVQGHYQAGKLFQSISLDTIQEKELDEIKQTFLPQELTLHTLFYPGYKPSEDIIAFHKELYEQNKIDAAFTCIREVYIELQKQGIPCYRVTATKQSIQQALKYLKERAQAELYKKAQIAIVAIDIRNQNEKKDASFYSMKQKYQELDLRRWLLHYAEKVGGSYMQIGDGTFFIYTTRGELEWHGDRLWFQFMKDAESNTTLQTNVVIGYGRTALEAESNARSALKEAQDKNSGTIIYVDENKRRTEHQPNNEVLSYETRRISQEGSADMTLSPAVINKISSLSRHYDQDLVTAQDISTWLNSSLRNANRILAKLEDMNLAKQTGGEQSGQRGRPRRIYRLDIH
ncbi:hypothetical protein [Alkalicoccobacillus porphyridii]|uniref:Transcriptional regulator n=1 Tax=Alkalicoccobacillus porphyridii TaxID=2597270 RepID=A0A554A1A5_9BACI|nr:hypothetical protein [Alkalicoccobacillus porphyridii]TSB47480.1 hypothetical protein FN960_07020 [Alkalicoccobacillus porphyridii]